MSGRGDCANPKTRYRRRAFLVKLIPIPHGTGKRGPTSAAMRIGVTNMAEVSVWRAFGCSLLQLVDAAKHAKVRI